MSVFLRGLKFLMMFVGAIFILMAFDSFFEEANLFEKVVGFIMGSLPGVIMMIVVYYLWCKEKILGILLTIFGIVMVFAFGAFENFPNELGNLIISGPITITGIIFIIYGRDKEKGCCKLK